MNLKIEVTLMSKTIVFLIVFLGASLSISESFAETFEFGIREIPSKIIEGHPSHIEIFTIKNGKLFPQPIDDLSITSQNPNLLEIQSQTNNENFNIDVLVNPKKHGNAKISLAANGYESQEFTIQIHQNQRQEKHLLLKAVPDAFSANSPKTGYLSVQLIDDVGNPIIASEDITVHYDVSQDDQISLNQKEMIIKKGSYYKIQKFELKSTDYPVMIYAKTENMPVAEERITVEPEEKPFTLKLYVSPEKTSIKSIGGTFAIVQLQDEDGDPIITNEDIPITVKIENPFLTGTILNEKGFLPQITLADPLVIPKGSYWTASKINTNAAIEGIYKIGISAKGYGAEEAQSLEIVNIDKSIDPKLEFMPLPTLFAGGKQLVGVAHLVNDEEILLSDIDLNFKILSSEENFSPNPGVIPSLNSAALVMADIGYFKPESLSVYESLKNQPLESPEIIGPTKQSLQLRSEPLIDKIISNTVFPVVTYVVDNDGDAWYFPTPESVFVSPSDLVSHTSSFVHPGQHPILQEMFTNKEGSENLHVQSGYLSNTLEVATHNVLSSQILVNTPDRIFVNSPTKIIVQLLDSQGNPIFANDDISISVISNDNSILEFTEPLKINRGENYEIIKITPKKIGSVEIALLATGFPLTKQILNIEEIKPQIVFDSPIKVNSTTTFDASISVKFDNDPVKNIPVSWTVDNGIIQVKDEKTNNEGIANIVVLSQNEDIKITALVSGNLLPQTQAVQKIIVNSDLLPFENNSSNYATFGSAAIIFGSIIAGGFVLKKRNLIYNKK